MADGLAIAFRAVQSAFGLYGALHVTTAIAAPRWFLDNLAINTAKERNARRPSMRNVMSPGEPWWSMPLTFLKIVAIGVLVYAALDAVVAVIPASWGSANEDGEWESVRGFLQGTGAFFGAIGIGQSLEKNAEVLVWAPLERDARQKLQDVLTDSNVVATDTLRTIRDRVDAKLAPEPNMPRGAEEQRKASVHQSFLRGLRR